MKLILRCAICDQVKESNQDTDELIDAEADEICVGCLICSDCDSADGTAYVFHEHLKGHHV